MMKRMLINVIQQEELCVVFVDGQCLYDLDIESFGYEQKKVNIYKGKIICIEFSFEVVFVDYGVECYGFFFFKEIVCEYFFVNYNVYGCFNIKDVLWEGQEVIVQIDKEECGNKGVVFIIFISLVGSYLVLMLNNLCVGGIFCCIEGDDCIELKEVLVSLEFLDGMGLIVCIVGVGKFVEVLQWDLSFCLKYWEVIQKVVESCLVLFLIYQESNVIVCVFCDYLCQDIGEILIDNLKVFELVCQYIVVLGCLDFSSKIKLYIGEILLFSYYQIEL